MKRIIKFRRWHKDLKDMIYSDKLSDFFSKVESYPPIYEVMQFTGLVDKNGKEIYEGDIVKWFVNNLIREGIVEYIDNYGGYDMKNFKDNYHVCCDWLRGEYEVIGNVYENPELL